MNSLKNVSCISVFLLFLATSTTSASTQDLDDKLMSAVVNGDSKAVKAHIAAGANVDAKDEYSRTLLMKAAEKGHTDIVRILIDAGANVNDTATNMLGSTALITASQYNHVEAAKALITAGANVNTASKMFGHTALMMTGNPEITQALITAGADVNATDCQGKTALMYTLEGDFGNNNNNNKIDKIRAIMAAKPNVDIRNNNGLTVVMLAERLVEKFDLQYYSVALKIITDPQGDLDNQLVYAAQYGDTKTVTALITAGANINATYRYGNTALMLAAQSGKTDIVKILIAAGAHVNAANEQGETALMKSVEFLRQPEQFSNILTVKALLAAGANINATNTYGETALQLATKKGRDDIVTAINDHLNSLNSKSLK